MDFTELLPEILKERMDIQWSLLINYWDRKGTFANKEEKSDTLFSRYHSPVNKGFIATN